MSLSNAVLSGVRTLLHESTFFARPRRREAAELGGASNGDGAARELQTQASCDHFENGIGDAAVKQKSRLRREGLGEKLLVVRVRGSFAGIAPTNIRRENSRQA
jgi:hypothetical protein